MLSLNKNQNIDDDMPDKRKKKTGTGTMGEEKPPKPKVLYKLVLEFWDDGEIIDDIVENVQGERGRPKAWRLNPGEFKRSLEKTLSQTPELLVDEILKAMDIDPKFYVNGLKARLDKKSAEIHKEEVALGLVNDPV